MRVTDGLTHVDTHPTYTRTQMLQRPRYTLRVVTNFTKSLKIV